MLFQSKTTLSRTTLNLSSPLLWDVQKSIFCSRNRSGLLIFSLSIIILLSQQAVALSIPAPSTSSSSLPASPASSLVMISPQVNNTAMASVIVPETVAMNVLTPGQRVINAVPAEDRGNFIIYQLAVGLKASYNKEIQPRWLSNLEELKTDFEQTIPEFKNVPVYENFATDLLQWLRDKFHLTHQDVYNHLSRRTPLLCTSDGVCYNSKDVCAFCCPF